MSSVVCCVVLAHADFLVCFFAVKTSAFLLRSLSFFSFPLYFPTRCGWAWTTAAVLQLLFLWGNCEAPGGGGGASTLEVGRTGTLVSARVAGARRIEENDINCSVNQSLRTLVGQSTNTPQHNDGRLRNHPTPKRQPGARRTTPAVSNDR